MTKPIDRLPLRDAPKPRRPPAPPGSASFYADLPAPPRGPDRTAAALYLATVRDYLAADLEKPKADRLSRAARATLQRIERTWAARVVGKDPRWNLIGHRAGRLTNAEAEQLDKEPTDWDRA